MEEKKQYTPLRSYQEHVKHPLALFPDPRRVSVLTECCFGSGVPGLAALVEDYLAPEIATARGVFIDRQRASTPSMSVALHHAIVPNTHYRDLPLRVMWFDSVEWPRTMPKSYCEPVHFTAVCRPGGGGMGHSNYDVNSDVCFGSSWAHKFIFDCNDGVVHQVLLCSPRGDLVGDFSYTISPEFDVSQLQKLFDAIPEIG